MHIEPVTFPLFRTVPGLQSRDETDALVADADRETDADQGQEILCRRCSHRITHTSARITIQGSFQHSFANPHGLVFCIGCFSSAQGCAYAGPFSYEFTWFKGYLWRIAVCAACRVHIGWLFVSNGGSRFNGLILDQLLEE